ncbi:MAG: hypothetical protein IT365_01840 [Candidatus Hydrogenedentes bacterium]|nr:hypothetical protein [Candidatus Hydrogenedentota bacterium]
MPKMKLEKSSLEDLNFRMKNDPKLRSAFLAELSALLEKFGVDTTDLHDFGVVKVPRGKAIDLHTLLHSHVDTAMVAYW